VTNTSTYSSLKDYILLIVTEHSNKKMNEEDTWIIVNDLNK